MDMSKIKTQSSRNNLIKSNEKNIICHVRGKRKAPPPPNATETFINPLPRKKRVAPQPPKKECGVLKSNNRIDKEEKTNKRESVPIINQNNIPWYKYKFYVYYNKKFKSRKKSTENNCKFNQKEVDEVNFRDPSKIICMQTDKKKSPGLFAKLNALTRLKRCSVFLSEEKHKDSNADIKECEEPKNKPNQDNRSISNEMIKSKYKGRNTNNAHRTKEHCHEIKEEKTKIETDSLKVIENLDESKNIVDEKSLKNILIEMKNSLPKKKIEMNHKENIQHSLNTIKESTCTNDKNEPRELLFSSANINNVSNVGKKISKEKYTMERDDLPLKYTQQKRNDKILHKWIDQPSTYSNILGPSTDINSPKKIGFLVNIYLEDKNSQYGQFSIKITEKQTVLDLKKQTETEFGIPINIQRWIFGNLLVTEDDATLEELNVSSNSIYLYIAESKEESSDKIFCKNKKEYVSNLDQSCDKKIDNDQDHNEISGEKSCSVIDNKISCNFNQITATKIEDGTSTTSTIKEKHYSQLIELENFEVVENKDPFDCLICLENISPGGGVILKECLHQFCKKCLEYTIQFNDEAVVKCPFMDENYSCDGIIQDREIKSLVDSNIYEKYLMKSLEVAKNRIDKTYLCKTLDCKGWCIYDDGAVEFKCPICLSVNCLSCKAIHTDKTCKEYQEEITLATDSDTIKTNQMLDKVLANGEALACPNCHILLMKKWGCDWIRCSVCKTEICWVTRGPRWGPGGKGDTSGGCMCGVNGIKCHPQCNYCH